MSAVPLGPNLADIVKNAALDSLAVDPGPLVAGVNIDPGYASAKRRRCELIPVLGGTAAEIEASAVILHSIEHNQMGEAAEGNNFRGVLIFNPTYTFWVS